VQVLPGAVGQHAGGEVPVVEDVRLDLVVGRARADKIAAARIARDRMLGWVGEKQLHGAGVGGLVEHGQLLWTTWVEQVHECSAVGAVRQEVLRLGDRQGEARGDVLRRPFEAGQEVGGGHLWDRERGRGGRVRRQAGVRLVARGSEGAALAVSAVVRQWSAGPEPPSAFAVDEKGRTEGGEFQRIGHKNPVQKCATTPKQL
jgi:hypothetical protein